MSRGAVALYSGWSVGVRPRARLKVTDWADAHRILSAKGANEEGPWRTARTPYLAEIMDTLSDSSPVQRVSVIKSTQVGLTEVALNWIGYHIARGLGPMLVVLPTLDVRKRWVLQRLHPMLRDTAVLAELVSSRKRDAANSEDIKDFPAALLVLSGANSPSSLRSMPVKHVICDELTSFPWDAGGEGDPLGLIERRTANFPRRKILLISSPAIVGACRITDEYEASDQRRYYVPCPECGHYQPLEWGNLVFDKALTWARYACRDCGVEIEEHHKTRMLAAGRWIAKYPERKNHRGYQINAIYAPHGLGLNWLELARDWVAAQDDPSKLKRFVNTALAEAWEDKSRKVKASTLEDRAEPYRLRQVPAGCLVLTAGVDTQDDRLAVLVVGWGENDNAWILDYHEIEGNPGRLEIWDQLSKYLNEPLVNSAGRALKIEATAIDTGGHYTHEVYQYERRREITRPLAIKGASTPGRSILGRATWQDVNVRGRRIYRGVRLWPIGTDTAKHLIFSRLHSDEDQPPEARRLHFSEDLDGEFYKQLTGEVFDPVKNKWVRRGGKRVEVLDCLVYATAASQHPEIRVHAKTARAWQKLRDEREGAQASPPGGGQVVDKPAPPRRRRRLFPGGVG